MPKEPLFSIRRIAQTAALEARVANVRTRLAGVAAQLPAQSCLLARANTRVLAAVRSEQPLVPASNMKVFVAAAALDVLGAEYRFETRRIPRNPAVSVSLTDVSRFVGR
ncbi:MAG: hypothetical protein EBT46_00570 [Actinobacteria bacterium]|nr:hypothetical protein [Actinomycetota bacterium]